MNRFVSTVCALSMMSLLAACGDAGVDAATPLFPERPECTGESITPLSGQQPMLMSFLEVGKAEDGLDLDGDGQPDNKLAGVGTLANDSIANSFNDFSIVIPFEFFDTKAQLGADECIKFAIYLGNYKFDKDGDDGDTADNNGDCNDNDPAINKSAIEDPTNGKDDDCDGLADEAADNTPSDKDVDADNDGVTIANGDCDDTEPLVGGTGSVEICGDGLDNDCDGNADFGMIAGQPACSPYDATPDQIGLDPLAFDNGQPIIAFPAGTISAAAGGGFAMEAGPSVFSIAIPVSNDISLALSISGATITADIEETANGWALNNGRLGGVIDSRTADRIRGLTIDQIGLDPEDSLLDAIYANILGTLLGIPKVTINDIDCQTGDIDVDRDGLEAFCDTTPLDAKKTVDMCVDGNGEIIMDEVNAAGEVITHCTEALDADGKPRFVDGISVELNFRTVPALLPATLPTALR